YLVELYRAVHGLAGAANYARLRNVTQLCCALETLLKELNAKPQKITPSSLHTITHAIDLLTPLLQHARENEDDSIPSPLILVLDDEPISRETTCSALEYAQLRALSLDDPEIALRVLAENRFDLIFMDVQMPGMDGFEACQRIHATAANPNTPIVFITAMNSFDTRARSSLSGGVDFVTKPILMIEIAVKALTHLLRAHCHLASSTGAKA
ncbi:MAG TPA: response regulator, partial [Candidatus Paceibacterota bacterium]|nr:response regulator [Candidatus Paceibacterota bacterium]